MRKLLSAAMIALAGCCNILLRPERAAWACDPYENTCEVAAVVAMPFSVPKGPEGGIAKAYATLLLPVSLVDLPLEAVADTVFLPWDLGWKLAR